MLQKDAEKHCGTTLEQLLSTIQAPQELLGDIRAHYASLYGAEYPLNTMLRKCLYCVDELTGFRMLREYFRDLLARGNAVVVAPDLGFANEARKLFAEPLGLPLALPLGRRCQGVSIGSRRAPRPRARCSECDARTARADRPDRRSRRALPGSRSSAPGIRAAGARPRRSPTGPRPRSARRNGRPPSGSLSVARSSEH